MTELNNSINYDGGNVEKINNIYAATFENRRRIRRWGAYPHPGEISLSHNGVLFLDELHQQIAESIQYGSLDREGWLG